VPKAKPTEVFVHRIDIQPGVKESVDAFLVGKTLTNAVSAVGSVLSGLGPALGVIAGWYLADKALDEAVDAVTGYFRKKGAEIADERYGSSLDHYRLVMATLEASTDWESLQAQTPGMVAILREGETNFEPVYDKWVLFRVKLMTEIQAKKPDPPWLGWGKPMSRAWKAFYPVDALMQDMKNDLYSMGGQIDKMPWPVGWVVRKSTGQS